MKILVLGSGGREHALAWKLVQSKRLTRLFVAPGNAGTAAIAENIQVKPGDFKAVKQLVLDQAIEMVVVGPEAPLVSGIADFFQTDDQLKNVAVIGPGKKGAQLEGSKDFAKAFMGRHNIPTARYQTFYRDNYTDALDYLRNHENPPYVIKADGLAAGKGVSICQHFNDASENLHNMLLGGKFGKASASVVIEQYLEGTELSVFVITDGKSYKILPSAKDYKRIGENDTGPNTGGMGSISPVPFAGETFMNKVEEQIIKPTIKGLQKESIPFKGFIFFGLMNVKGDPYVVEYNVRLGDPEAEVVLPRIKTDMLDLLEATWNEKLDNSTLDIDKQYATAVMLASGGYPGEYEKGKPITGIEQVKESIVFQAGTKQGENKNLLTSGGRVMAVTGMDETLEKALEKTYRSIKQISFERMYFRKDIGKDLMSR